MIHADAFEWIEQGPKCGFDFVILDPPSLAKREAERSRAIQAYRKLASGGIQRLKRGWHPGGGVLFGARLCRRVLYCGAPGGERITKKIH